MDATGYVVAKAAYIKSAETGNPFPWKARVMDDLDARLRALIGPLPVPGAVWKLSLDVIPTKGNEGGEQLDGLVTKLGNATILISTPELLAAWVKFNGDSAGDPMKSVATENMLTWAFMDGGHVFPFVDLARHSALPTDVFFAKLAAEGNDYGAAAPDQVLIGVARQGRIYLIKAPLDTKFPAVEGCGGHSDERYYLCYDTKADSLPQVAEAAKQVARLASLIPAPG